ncbi:MAG: tetratricopeptide repeat protein, partial [Anaerolineae bacterium]
GVLATGLLGTSLYVLLLGYVMWRGLTGLGLVRGRRNSTLLISSVVAGGILGAVAARLVGGRWGHGAVGLPLGWVAGLGLYLTFHAFTSNVGDDRLGDNQSWLTMALLSGLVAHFIESQFSIVVAASQVCLWLFSAVILRWAEAGFAMESESVTQPDTRKSKLQEHGSAGLPGQTTLIYGLLTGVILVTLSYGFVIHNFPMDAKGWAVAGLVIIVWAVGGGLAWARAERSRGQAFSWVGYAIVSVGLTLLYLALHVIILPRADWTGVIYVFAAALAVVVITLAVALSGGLPQPAGGWLHPKTWVYPLVLIGLMGVAVVTNLRPIRADMYYKAALVAERKGEIGGTIPVFRRAIELAPYREDYYLSLARASQTRAEASPTLTEQTDWWQRAEGALKDAQQLNPYNSDYPAALGEVYRIRGEGAAAPVERVRWFEDALKFYRRALELSPERAGQRVDRFVLQAQLELGDAYADLGLPEAAVASYQEARVLEPDDYRVHLRLAGVLEEMGRHQEALA